MSQPEKVEQAHIVQLLKSIRGAVWVIGMHRRRGDYQGTMQTEGYPDLTVFLPVTPTASSCLLFIEVKAGRGRLRPEQQAFQLHCQAAGVAHVVGDYNTVVAWLIEHGYLKREQVPHYRLSAEGAGLKARRFLSPV